ncbi:MAG: M48 family metalloprotease [Phycisphaerales bacterium]|nr:M48 family metalloprotease [Phycisphaerales bacterium]
MIHLSLIFCFMAVFLREPIAASLGVAPLEPLHAALATLAGFAVLVLVVDLRVRMFARIVDATGTWAAVYAAENTVRQGRLAAVALHVFNTTVLGWVEAVRTLTGDVILLDELVMIAPLIVTWAAGWWSLEPVERRVREAALIRSLDHGRPIHPPVTRWGFVLTNVRYHVLLLLIPMCLLLGWAETVERLAPRYLGIQAGSGWAIPLQLAGVVILFALMPMGLRLVWDTVPIGPGKLRESLTELCRRCGVRVGDLLLWRTHGLMLNGAVIGLFWPLRYILLTDALLETLPPEQVRAVAAHEVGHVRRRHLIWLGVTMVTTLMSLSLIAAIVQVPLAASGGVFASPLVEAAFAIAIILVAMTVMGFVSRRFEWQADAFAVVALSRVELEGGGSRSSPVVTPEAAATMQAALSAVAAASGLPLRKFTWRHGSIWTRQRKLAGLVGRPVSRLPIDREVSWLKLTISLVALVVVASVAGLYGLLQLAAFVAGPQP